LIDLQKCLDDGLYEFPDKSMNSFGWYQMSEIMFKHILDTLPDGKVVLELGSGWGSSQLAEHYTVYTIEHDSTFVGKYPDVNYIHSPLDPYTGWYELEPLAEQLPKHYDMIIVDGPSGGMTLNGEKLQTSRNGFNKNIELFNTDVPIFWDDTHFIPAYNAFMELAIKLKRIPHLYAGDYTKSYGVLY
jgi:hypothetical protein